MMTLLLLVLVITTAPTSRLRPSPPELPAAPISPLEVRVSVPLVCSALSVPTSSMVEPEISVRLFAPKLLSLSSRIDPAPLSPMVSVPETTNWSICASVKSMAWPMPMAPSPRPKLAAPEDTLSVASPPPVVSRSASSSTL